MLRPQITCEHICQRVTVSVTAANNNHQIKVTWVLITRTCNLSSALPISTTRSLTLMVRSTVHYPEQYLTLFYLTCDLLTLLSPRTPPAILQRSSSDPPVCVLFSCASQLYDSWERDSDQFTAVSHRVGSPFKSRTCSSHLTQFNLSINPLSCYLPVSPCSVCDRRPDQHRHSHGSPTFLTVWNPGGAGQHSAGLTPATTTPSICLCQSHGPTSCLRGWFGWVWRLSITTSLVHRDATTEVSHRALQGSIFNLPSIRSSIILG